MLLLPIVEGHGEVQAGPELIRRIVQRAGRYDIEVRSGYRIPRSQLREPEKLQYILEAAYVQYKPDLIVVLFDADDDCPKRLNDELKPICSEAATVSMVVAANREYEAWFLGSIRSLRWHCSVRPDAAEYTDPEIPRNAKGVLESRMTEPYAETLHQRKMSGVMALDEAYNNCRSFRHLCDRLLAAVQPRDP